VSEQSSSIAWIFTCLLSVCLEETIVSVTMSKREIADLLIDVSELSGGRIHRRPRSGESEEREEIEDDDYDFRPPYDLFDSVCDCSDDSDFRPPYDLFDSVSDCSDDSDLPATRPV